jgi:hypothetical protein
MAQTGSGCRSISESTTGWNSVTVCASRGIVVIGSISPPTPARQRVPLDGQGEVVEPRAALAAVVLLPPSFAAMLAVSQGRACGHHCQNSPMAEPGLTGRRRRRGGTGTSGRPQGSPTQATRLELTTLELPTLELTTGVDYVELRRIRDSNS